MAIGSFVTLMINLEQYLRRVREARNARDTSVPLAPPRPEPTRPRAPIRDSQVSAGPTSPSDSVKEVIGGLAVLGGLAGFYAAGEVGVTVASGVIVGVLGGGLVVPLFTLVARLTDVRDHRAGPRS